MVVDRCEVLENGDHSLVNYMKRMTEFVVSRSERKQVVAKTVRHLVRQNLALFPQFELQDGGLTAKNYFDAHLACNSNKTSSIVFLRRCQSFR